MERLFRTFVEQPNARTYLAVRHAILAESADCVAAADIRKLQRWLSNGNAQAAILAAERLPSTAALSPRIHFLMAQAALTTGDLQTHELERLLFQASLKGLLATGNGTEECPYCVCQPSDEYDLLLSLKLQPLRQVQTAAQQGFKEVSDSAGHAFDRIICRKVEDRAAGKKPGSAKPDAPLPRILGVDTGSDLSECGPDEVEVWFDSAGFRPQAMLSRLQVSDVLEELTSSAAKVTRKVRKDSARRSEEAAESAPFHIFTPASTAVKRRARVNRTPR